MPRRLLGAVVTEATTDITVTARRWERGGELRIDAGRVTQSTALADAEAPRPRSRTHRPDGAIG